MTGAKAPSPTLSRLTLAEARAVLGVTDGADAETVRSAFRTAAKAAHPDQPGGDAARFRRVVEAHRLIQAHAQALAVVAARAVPQPEAVAWLDIGVAEAVGGAIRAQVLPDGRTVRVTLPAGLRSGDRMRFGGKTPVVMTVRIRAEGALRVIGDDIWMTAGASPGLLADGGRLMVETPAGPRAVWITRGQGRPLRLRLKGEGLPERGDRPRGHLFIEVSEADEARPDAAERLAKFARAWTRAA